MGIKCCGLFPLLDKCKKLNPQAGGGEGGSGTAFLMPWSPGQRCPFTGIRVPAKPASVFAGTLRNISMMITVI